jgi:hypothetical protein
LPLNSLPGKQNIIFFGVITKYIYNDKYVTQVYKNVMNEPIKIAQEELSELNTLKDEITKIIFEFGELYLEKMELDALYKSLSDKELELRNKKAEFKKREIGLMDTILKKYGEGNLNVRDGTLTPTQKTT